MTSKNNYFKKINASTVLITSKYGPMASDILSMISWPHVGSTFCSTTSKESSKHQLQTLPCYPAKFVTESLHLLLVISAINITQDGVNHFIKKGQRTPWYIFGLVLVITCYIPIYMGFKSDSVGV